MYCAIIVRQHSDLEVLLGWYAYKLLCSRQQKLNYALKRQNSAAALCMSDSHRLLAAKYITVAFLLPWSDCVPFQKAHLCILMNNKIRYFDITMMKKATIFAWCNLNNVFVFIYFLYQTSDNLFLNNTSYFTLAGW